MCVDWLKRAALRHPLLARVRKLARDRDGSAFFYTTISLPVLFGFALLAIDGSRYTNLHSSLQHAADAIALAAAGELDKRTDSLLRAKSVIDNEVVLNQQRFGQAGLADIGASDVRARFLRSLPADDATPMPAWGQYTSADCVDCVVAYLEDDLTDPELAEDTKYIEVHIEQQNLQAFFAVFSDVDVIPTTAMAIAGYGLALCQFAPLFMCNPFEDDDPGTPTIFEFVENEENEKKMIELRLVGPDADYFPGNFAFLDSPLLGNGAEGLREALARTNPNSCFNVEGVDTEPGQNMGPVRQGLNVRFDIYEGPMSSRMNNPEYRPGINVRKGFNPPGCSGADSNDDVNFRGFPRDQTIDTTLSSGGRIYAGDWAFNTYWDVNFDHNAYGTEPIQAPNGWDTDTPSRYDVYRYEIDNNLMSKPSRGGETGVRSCSSSTTSDDPDRRILYAAIVNCMEEGPLRGSETDIPVVTYAKFFLIRPLGASDSIDIELIDVVEPGAEDNVAHKNVQLFR